VVVETEPSSLVTVSVTSLLTRGSLLMTVTASVVTVSTSFSRVLTSSSFEETDLPVVSSVTSSVMVETIFSVFSIVSLTVFSSFSIFSILVSMILI
jgi:hypothetical protein